MSNSWTIIGGFDALLIQGFGVILGIIFTTAAHRLNYISPEISVHSGKHWRSNSILAISSGLLFYFTWEHTMHHVMVRICWLLFWLCLIMVTSTDLRTMRVPNRISLSAAILFTGFGLMGTVHAWQTTVLGIVCCAGLLLLVNLVTHGRGMGMGDVKLYITIGAMLGPVLGLESLIAASTIASTLGICLMAARRMRRGQPFAFVPYIFAGVAVTTFYGPSFNQWYLFHFWT